MYPETLVSTLRQENGIFDGIVENGLFISPSRRD